MIRIVLLTAVLSFNLAFTQISIPSTIKLKSRSSELSLLKSKASASLLMVLNGINNPVISSIITKPVIIQGKDYLDCFIDIRKDDFYLGVDALKQLGVIIRGQYGSIVTAYVPLDVINDVLNLEYVKYIEPAKPVIAQLDSARKAVRADSAYSGFGLSRPFRGDSVIVGIVDQGFDLTHPTLYDTFGTTYRVLYLWDQYDSTGAAPSPYGYGSEFTASQILSISVDYSYNAGESSHGMHVAGIAAGSGFQKPQYRGIAPNAHLVLVEVDNSSDAKFIDAIDYVFKKADQLNMPAVVNLSFGGLLGPRDGTSLFDQSLTFLAGPGRIVVGAAANEGDKKFHIGFNFNYSTGDTLIITFPSCDTGIIDIWGATADFYVILGIIDTVTGLAEAIYVYSDSPTTSYSGILTYTGSGEQIGYQVYREFTNPYNNKRHILIYYRKTNYFGPNKTIFIALYSYGADIHAWNLTLGMPCELSDGGYGYPFVSGDNSYTIGELGCTSDSIICVGAYTTKTAWNSIVGPVNISYVLYDIAPFSSRGPRTDEQLRPHITAPGAWIVSSINDIDVSVPVQNVVSNDYRWGAFQGTNMATPVVTGIVALWLQANPNLSVKQTMQLLQQYAIKDQYTGPVANNTWGHGKVDAYQFLSDNFPYVQPDTTTTDSTNDNADTTYTSINSLANRNKPVIRFNNLTGYLEVINLPANDNVCIINSAGRTVECFSVRRQHQYVQLPDIPYGIYVAYSNRLNQHWKFTVLPFQY